jgi:hypothetical protein
MEHQTLAEVKMRFTQWRKKCFVTKFSKKLNSPFSQFSYAANE